MADKMQIDVLRALKKDVLAKQHMQASVKQMEAAAEGNDIL